MPNMSYCRFRNTLTDLRDCYQNFDEYVSKEESVARTRLYEVCKAIVDNFEPEDFIDNVEE